MRLVTWNMQGQGSDLGEKWDCVVDFIQQYGVHAICLQKCGELAGSDIGKRLAPQSNGAYAGVINLGTQSSPTNVFVVWLESGQSGNRCSLAIMARECMGVTHVVVPASQTSRPLVGLQYCCALDVFSMHAPSGGEQAAAGMAKSLLSAIPAYNNGRPWVCAGDYNCKPNSMTGPHWAVADNGYQPTRRGGRYSGYATYSGCSTACDTSVLNVMVSNHHSQAFEVQPTERTSVGVSKTASGEESLLLRTAAARGRSDYSSSNAPMSGALPV